MTKQELISKMAQASALLRECRYALNPRGVTCESAVLPDGYWQARNSLLGALNCLSVAADYVVRIPDGELAE